MGKALGLEHRMAMEHTQITCPKCGTRIDVQDLLSHQIEDEFKKKYDSQRAELLQKYTQEKQNLEAQRAQLEAEKKNQEALIKAEATKKAEADAKALEVRLRAQMDAEYQGKDKAREEELKAKTEQLKEMHRVQTELERIKREKDGLKEQLELENEKKLRAQLEAEREKIQKTERERNELKVAELQKKLDDQTKLTEEMRRKQEQGSMQLQGEVLELAIEDYLRANFPLDTIEEVKKGARGGDCIQIVNTRAYLNCGKIYYESKRTKAFSDNWIAKFKADMQAEEAHVGVLVTEAMPAGMERMGLKDGVWVCTFEEFKALCHILREFVQKLHAAGLAQENKGDKMSLLYDYLVGNTFKMQVEAIVTGFVKMKDELEKERRAMARIWKEREKQIDLITHNTIEMHASIRAIAGSALPAIQQLELGGDQLAIDSDQ